MQEKVILVDERDVEIGLEEKMKAHEQALLHRAFSVFIFNLQGEMLLQQRAMSKYHSGGLWTNACCSHPRPHEPVERAAHRRLQEEMGFDCPLHHSFHFIYRAELDRGLTEHELDHVFIGTYHGIISPDPGEVAGYRWMNLDVLKADVMKNPQQYTVWFRIALQEVLEKGQHLSSGQV